MTASEHSRCRSSGTGCRDRASRPRRSARTSGVPPVREPMTGSDSSGSSSRYFQMDFGREAMTFAVENTRDRIVVVVDFERTEAIFTAGEKFDGIFASAFAAFETLDEAHGYRLSSLNSFDRGQMKKPRAKQHGAFSKPFRSCLAVFYVEQVALNRHVHCDKNKGSTTSKNLTRPAAQRQE